MSSIDLWIVPVPPQLITKEPYIIPNTEVSVLGIYANAIFADSLEDVARLGVKQNAFLAVAAR